MLYTGIHISVWNARLWLLVSRRTLGRTITDDSKVWNYVLLGIQRLLQLRVGWQSSPLVQNTLNLISSLLEIINFLINHNRFFLFGKTLFTYRADYGHGFTNKKNGYRCSPKIILKQIQ